MSKFGWKGAEELAPDAGQRGPREALDRLDLGARHQLGSAGGADEVGDTDHGEDPLIAHGPLVTRARAHHVPERAGPRVSERPDLITRELRTLENLRR